MSVRCCGVAVSIIIKLPDVSPKEYLKPESYPRGVYFVPHCKPHKNWCWYAVRTQSPVATIHNVMSLTISAGSADVYF